MAAEYDFPIGVNGLAPGPNGGLYYAGAMSCTDGCDQNGGSYLLTIDMNGTLSSSMPFPGVRGIWSTPDRSQVYALEDSYSGDDTVAVSTLVRMNPNGTVDGSFVAPSLERSTVAGVSGSRYEDVAVDDVTGEVYLLEVQTSYTGSYPFDMESTDNYLAAFDTEGGHLDRRSIGIWLGTNGTSDGRTSFDFAANNGELVVPGGMSRLSHQRCECRSRGVSQTPVSTGIGFRTRCTSESRRSR